MSEKNNWANDGEYFYPCDEATQVIDTIEAYLNSSRFERFFYKKSPEDEAKRREAVIANVVVGSGLIGSAALLACMYSGFLYFVPQHP